MIQKQEKRKKITLNELYLINYPYICRVNNLITKQDEKETIPTPCMSCDENEAYLYVGE